MIRDASCVVAHLLLLISLFAFFKKQKSSDLKSEMIWSGTFILLVIFSFVSFITNLVFLVIDLLE